MKKAAIIFLLALMGLVQTPAAQLCRIPLLIEHFNKHQAQEGDDLISFLEEHYTSDHQDNDQPEDDQLPFKNMPVIGIGYALLTTATVTNLTALIYPVKRSAIISIHFPAQQLESVFHPPRT